MLAIFQSNPSAFQQNMNVLRSGAVLRMPEGSEVSAVSPSEAATEIRRQYAAWRGGAAPEGGAPVAKQSGQLHLVTPSGDTGPATGPSANSGEVKALQGRVRDLEGQLSESKRLLRNAERAARRSAGEVRRPARCSGSTAPGRAAAASRANTTDTAAARGAAARCPATAGRAAGCDSGTGRGARRAAGCRADRLRRPSRLRSRPSPLISRSPLRSRLAARSSTR